MRIPTGLILLAALASGSCTTPADEGENVESTSEALQQWVKADYAQMLVGAGGTVRSRCMMKVALDEYKPLTFIASSGGPSVATGWTGAAVNGPLRVNGCAEYPCEVTARLLDVHDSGESALCTISVDDGSELIEGNNDGNTMTTDWVQDGSRGFVQQMKLDRSGARVANLCQLFARNFAFEDNVLSGFSVYRDGDLLLASDDVTFGPAKPWPTPYVDVAFGNLDVGVKAATSSATFRHVTPRTEVDPGQRIACTGSFIGDEQPAFVVNSEVPEGGTIQTAPSQWSCETSSFGKLDGCQADCGTPDPDCGVLLMVSDATVTEGDGASASFTVSLSQVAPTDVTFQAVTEAGSALSAVDYAFIYIPEIVIPQGSKSVDVLVPILNEDTDEDDQTFSLKIAPVAGAAVYDDTGTGTIVDDDELPILYHAPSCTNEGNPGELVGGSFQVIVYPRTDKTVKFHYQTYDVTAVANDDYLPVEGDMTFPPATLFEWVNVLYVSDAISEPHETFGLDLSAVENAVLWDDAQLCQIINDD